MQGRQTQHPSRSEQVHTLQARIRVSSQGMPTNPTMKILTINQPELLGWMEAKVFFLNSLDEILKIWVLLKIKMDNEIFKEMLSVDTDFEIVQTFLKYDPTICTSKYLSKYLNSKRKSYII